MTNFKWGQKPENNTKKKAANLGKKTPGMPLASHNSWTAKP